MKLSCLPVSFFAEIIAGRMRLGEWACLGAALGLDAIDLSILFLPDRSPRAVSVARAEIEAHGLGVAMVTSYPDFTHPDPEQRRLELEAEVEVVETAALMGARMVRVTAGQAHPQVDREAGIEWAVEGLAALVERTRGVGVTLVYENHAKPGAWEHTDFSQPPDIFLEIARGTAAAGLGINFDTGNAAAFSDAPLALLEQVIDRVVSVHASDTAVHGALEHVLLGTGITPFPQLFARLRRAGWDGWICLEEASYQGEAGMRAAVNFIRNVWENAGAAD